VSTNKEPVDGAVKSGAVKGTSIYEGHDLMTLDERQRGEYILARLSSKGPRRTPGDTVTNQLSYCLMGRSDNMGEISHYFYINYEYYQAYISCIYINSLKQQNPL
jgi:hypothetical protein